MPEFLSAHSSAHASLPQFGPVRSSAKLSCIHIVTLQIHLQHYRDKESRAILLKRCSIPFPCNQRANNNKPMGKWVHDQFGESSKILFCAHCMEK